MTENAERPSPLDMTRADVDMVVGIAGLATHGFASRFRKALAECTETDREALMLRFAVTWLLANGLVVTAPDGAFEQMFSLNLPDEFAGDVDRHLREALARKAHFDGMASAARMHLVPARPGDWAE